jgi:DNA-binding NtrC family response regulator
MELSPKIIKATTLLVDDDQLIRDSMRLAFRNQACFIQVVESAEEALCILNKVNFDVIISDFELPGIDGLEFLKQVMTLHPDNVALLISGNGSDETVKRAYEIGIHDFLQKPFSVKSLWVTMAMHLQKRNGGKKPSSKAAKKTHKKTARKSDTHDTATGPTLSSLKIVDGEAQI